MAPPSDMISSAKYTSYTSKQSVLDTRHTGEGDTQGPLDTSRGGTSGAARPGLSSAGSRGEATEATGTGTGTAVPPASNDQSLIPGSSSAAQSIGESNRMPPQQLYEEYGKRHRIGDRGRRMFQAVSDHLRSDDEKRKANEQIDEQMWKLVAHLPWEDDYEEALSKANSELDEIEKQYRLPSTANTDQPEQELSSEHEKLEYVQSGRSEQRGNLPPGAVPLF
ncbi:hypothetical protein IAT40_004102 [Kwoniella sp. CBS 6097]